jgi:hypothetical protein
MFKVMHVKSHRSLYLEPLDKSHRTSSVNRTALYICRYLYLYLYRYLSRVFCGFCGYPESPSIAPRWGVNRTPSWSNCTLQSCFTSAQSPLCLSKNGEPLWASIQPNFARSMVADAEGARLSALGRSSSFLEGDIHCPLTIFQNI